jgi:hypothetical protein
MNRIALTLDRGCVAKVCADDALEVYFVDPSAPRDRVYLYGATEVGPQFVRQEIGGFGVGHAYDGTLSGTGPVNPRLPPSRPKLNVVEAGPDADLLDLCAKLAAMQAEWQRLWNFTSEDWGLDGPPTTEADHEWLRYNDEVWPAINISGQSPRHPDDLPGRLLDFHPVTPEGIRAKAAAVLAMDDAGCYGADLRNDSYELYHSALVDAAGPARCLMGEDAPKVVSGG